MECRKECGACCIAPSITSPLPAMPGGKPAGVQCPHLTPDLLCGIFGSPGRPQVCTSFLPSLEHCGATAEEALTLLARLEAITAA